MNSKNFVFALVLSIFLSFSAVVSAQMKVSSNAPDFSGKTLDGKTVKLSDFKGKVVLITFWATWCPFCAKMLPRIEKELWKTSGNSGDFMFLAIAPDDPEAKVKAHVKKEGFTFPVISDPNKEIYKLFTAGGMPVSYVINADGKILAARTGYKPEGLDKIKQQIETAIKVVRDAKKPKTATKAK